MEVWLPLGWKDGTERNTGNMQQASPASRNMEPTAAVKRSTLSNQLPDLPEYVQRACDLFKANFEVYSTQSQLDKDAKAQLQPHGYDHKVALAVRKQLVRKPVLKIQASVQPKSGRFGSAILSPSKED